MPTPAKPPVPTSPDKISLQRLGRLHPKLRDEALCIYEEICQAGLHVRVTFTLRSVAEQNCLYAQGRGFVKVAGTAVQQAVARDTNNQRVAAINRMRAAAGLAAIGAKDAAMPVTKAQGGQSWHNYGLALDVALLLDSGEVSWNESLDLNKDLQKDWQQITAIFLKHGWEWGGGPAFIKAGIRDAPHYQKRFGLTIRQALALFQAGKVDAQGYIHI